MDRFCYSIANMGFEYYEFIIHYFGKSYIEIRLDQFLLGEAGLRNLLHEKRTSKIIVACPKIDPISSRGNDPDIKLVQTMLLKSVEYGADLIDIRSDIEPPDRKSLIEFAHSKGCSAIISYHCFNFDAPSLKSLCQIVEDFYGEGADIVKIVLRDNFCGTNFRKVKNLYKKYKDKKGRLIAFVMGICATETRWDSLDLGAPFTYVALGDCTQKADGELTYSDLFNPEDERLHGDADLPASKSVAQRAILLAALCNGHTVLRGVTLCDDTVSAITIAKALGAKIDLNNGILDIFGADISSADRIRIPEDGFFHAGESGFLARSCVAMSAVAGKDCIVLGEKTLQKRKFGRELSALQAAGVSIELNRGEYLPAQVHGAINTDRINLSGVYGSQLISGLMMMLPLVKNDTRLQVINAASFNYMDLTKAIMKKFGVNVGMEADSDSKRIAFDIHGGSTYKSPKPFKIERDWSAAAMMICIGAISGKLKMKGLSFNSHQPDSIIIPILCRCGADIELQGFSRNIYQTFSATTINRSLLIPFAVDITDIPDLFPALFILALRCAGPSVIQGISRLRNKESDRAATFFKEFTKLGVKMEIKDEEMTIWGSPMMTVLGGKVSSHGDHRLAMALLAASLISVGKIEIDDLSCLAKSYPDFRNQLAGCIVDPNFKLPE